MNMGMDDFHANNNGYFCQFGDDPSLPPLPETLSSTASNEMLLQPQGTGSGFDNMGWFSCDDQLLGMQANPVSDVNINHRRAQSEIIAFPVSDFTFDGGMVPEPDETNQQVNEVRPHVQRRREISAAKLEELARVDPKKARRVHANRQAALRSKEKKEHYVSDLEQKVQTLQAQVASLSTELDHSQNQVCNLTSANTRLKLQLETMDLQLRLRDAQNNALRHEMEDLKKLQPQ